ncbi:MAG: type II secretion system protein N [Bacillota bacterium]
MNAVSSPIPSRNPLGTALVVALVLLLAWLLAHWTWVFVAPARVASPPSSDSTVDLAVASRLFGGNVVASTSASSSALKLKGVVAPTPGVAASAIFSTGAGKDLSIFVGSEVLPGVKLAEVYPDHVILSRAGVNERVDLEEMHGTGKPARSPRMVGFRLNVSKSGANSYALSRKELDDALRDPNQLSYLGQIGMPPGGGVRMESVPPGSLAQKLGLQPGDVIKKVNGQDVASTGDLARLYTQFNTISAIQAEIQRGGSSVQLSYAINP